MVLQRETLGRQPWVPEVNGPWQGHCCNSRTWLCARASHTHYHIIQKKPVFRRSEIHIKSKSMWTPLLINGFATFSSNRCKKISDIQPCSWTFIVEWGPFIFFCTQSRGHKEMVTGFGVETTSKPHLTSLGWIGAVTVNQTHSMNMNARL